MSDIGINFCQKKKEKVLSTMLYRSILEITFQVWKIFETTSLAHGIISEFASTDPAGGPAIRTKADSGWVLEINGKIDDVRIFNRALNSEEVRAIFQDFSQ